MPIDSCPYLEHTCAKADTQIYVPLLNSYTPAETDPCNYCELAFPAPAWYLRKKWDAKCSLHSPLHGPNDPQDNILQHIYRYPWSCLACAGGQHGMDVCMLLPPARPVLNCVAW